MIAYPPGLTMRRVADLHAAGSAKTDARDAFIIAETARTMPSALRQIAVSDEQIAELAVLSVTSEALRPLSFIWPQAINTRALNLGSTALAGSGGLTAQDALPLLGIALGFAFVMVALTVTTIRTVKLR